MVHMQDDTPLSLACRQATIGTVQALLKCKADVTAKNKHGLTALGEAIIRQKLDVVEEILRFSKVCFLLRVVCRVRGCIGNTIGPKRLYIFPCIRIIS